MFTKLMPLNLNNKKEPNNNEITEFQEDKFPYKRSITYCTMTETLLSVASCDRFIK